MSKITLFAACFGSIMLTYHIEAQITEIPDTNFEQALIDLKIDSDGVINGQVLTTDVQTLTSLDVSQKDIINLTGIQDFASLEALYCQNNLLQSINVSENKELQILDCSSNLISGLSVRDNLKLKSLNFGSNAISEINVSDNTDLEQLYVDKNELSTLNVKNNPKLTALNCSSNQLSILNITDNWYLKYLDISFNNLDLISLINGVNLEYLDVSSNPLTSLNLISLPALKTIRIVDNDLLPIIFFDSNPKLEYISCHDNEILGTIKLKDTDALTYLNCSNNDLTELITSQSPLLESLYCQNNKILSLDLHLNDKLAFLKCNDNDLEYLNIRNGQNTLLAGGDTEYEGIITYMEGLNATNNARLQCIDVDDETAASAGVAPYDSWLKDDFTAYSEDCQSYLGVDDYLVEHSVTLFPNPAEGIISITASDQNVVNVIVYSVLGNEIKEINSNFNNMSISDLNHGIYFVRIQLENGVVFKRLLRH
jgi:Leucine-rich repeat (LRR) protein